jgi:hypothetical protein
MFAKAWACAHPAHIVQRAFFEPQEISGFPDIQKWILVYVFHEFSPLIVTEVSRGEFGPWVTEHFPPIPGTAREQIIRTFSGQSSFCTAKISSKYMKRLAHPTGFEPVTSAFGASCLPPKSLKNIG